MSTVMRPKGPLPPQVYWTRRVLLVAVLALVVALLWWALPGFGGPGQASADPGAGDGSGDTNGQGPNPGSTTPAAADSTHQASQPPASGGTTHQPKSTGTPHHQVSTPDHPPPTHHAPPPTQAAPTEKCNTATLTTAVVVDSAPVGHGTSVGLRLSTPNGTTCSLAVTPNLLEGLITSGPATVWQSRSCPDAIPARNVVVGPHPRIVYSFQWDGKVDTDSCSASNETAQPGGYWATVALVGGEPHKTYFEVTSPSTPVHTS